MAAGCFSHQITLTACQVAGRMTRDLRGKIEAHHSTHLQLVKSHSDERVVALSAVASAGSGRLGHSRVGCDLKSTVAVGASLVPPG